MDSDRLGIPNVWIARSDWRHPLGSKQTLCHSYGSLVVSLTGLTYAVPLFSDNNGLRGVLRQCAFSRGSTPPGSREGKVAPMHSLADIYVT